MAQARSESVARGETIGARPAMGFASTDSESHRVVDLSRATANELVRRVGLGRAAANRLVAARADGPLLAIDDAASRARLRPADAERVARRGLLDAGDGLYVLDVLAEEGHLLSDREIVLQVPFASTGCGGRVVLALVRVLWAGEPFDYEREVTAQEDQAREVVLALGESRTLPVGHAEFDVVLYREDGAAGRFRQSAFVLPSNPLSLSVGPAGATVTGTWSARGDYREDSDTFLTEVSLTIANGDGVARDVGRRVDWEFWDGPVGGGTRVEAGAFDWPGAIRVPAYGTWLGTAWFSSPRGSGIYETYRRKEDMAISIAMSSTAGQRIQGEITARVMLALGVNIIKVGAFTGTEHVDLYDAVDRMRQIYERRDLTLRGVLRWIIPTADAGGYTVLDSETEYRGLLRDWSVRNDFIDVYVVQDFNWSTYNGYAGDIPGPASKGGDRDGVAVEKTGFTQADGTQRLSVETLAQLIGHEVGHYLGLSHQETTDNLMRSNTGNRGPVMDYDQYRTMLPHGYLVFL